MITRDELIEENTRLKIQLEELEAELVTKSILMSKNRRYEKELNKKMDKLEASTKNIIEQKDQEIKRIKAKCETLLKYQQFAMLMKVNRQALSNFFNEM